MPGCDVATECVRNLVQATRLRYEHGCGRSVAVLLHVEDEKEACWHDTTAVVPHCRQRASVGRVRRGKIPRAHAMSRSACGRVALRAASAVAGRVRSGSRASDISGQSDHETGQCAQRGAPSEVRPACAGERGAGERTEQRTVVGPVW